MPNRGYFRKSLLLKFMAPTAMIVLLVMALLGWVIARILESEVRDRANGKAQGQASSILSTLQTVDELSSAAVQSSMKSLLREGQLAGLPRIEGVANVDGETVPNLRLGASSQVGNFALVDRLKALTGSTATLFVKRGDSFVRISTNVLKPNGSRATGTVLDPKRPSLRCNS